MATKLSVIIPTRNRAPLLAKALESLLVQTLPGRLFEVVVVDNGSTDSTCETVLAFRERMPELRYFHEPEPGLHAGRHRGAVEARSDLLLFADDDIVALPSWLQSVADSFLDSEVAMVGGKCLPAFQSEPPPWLSEMWFPNAAGERLFPYLSLVDLGDEIKAVNPNRIFGCNFAIRRAVLHEACGFHPDSMPPELIHLRGDGESHVSDWVRTKGYRALYHPGASVYHWVPVERMTPEYFRRRARNQGISDSYSAIRRAGGISPRPAPRPAAPFSALIGALRRRFALGGKGAAARERAAISRDCDAAYRAGFDYHQAAVSNSPELLAWVLKEDYRDCRLPATATACEGHPCAKEKEVGVH